MLGALVVGGDLEHCMYGGECGCGEFIENARDVRATSHQGGRDMIRKLKSDTKIIKEGDHVFVTASGVGHTPNGEIGHKSLDDEAWVHNAEWKTNSEHAIFQLNEVRMQILWHRALIKHEILPRRVGG